MAPYRRVLVGIGGSDRDRDALTLARRLIDPRAGELILAHVDDDRSFRVLRPQPRAAPADLLAAARAEAGSGTAVSVRSPRAGSVARGLTELAEEADADIVVVGSAAPPVDGRITPGRLGMRLVQGAPCAVALVPAGASDAGPFHHVGIAFDGSPEAAAALAAGYAIAARDGAAVTLYHVMAAFGGGGSGAAEEVDAGLRADRLRAHQQLDAAADAAPAGVNPRTVLLHGDPAQRIAAACDGIVDVLFAGSRGYGPMHRALAGSVSEGLLLLSTQPVVITPRGEKPAAGDLAREAPADRAPA